MPARQTKNLRIVFRADEFDVIAKELGLTTDAEKAAFLNTSAANFSRIRAPKPRSVGATFIACALTSMPRVDFYRLFRIETG